MNQKKMVTKLLKKKGSILYGDSSTHSSIQTQENNTPSNDSLNPIPSFINKEVISDKSLHPIPFTLSNELIYSDLSEQRRIPFTFSTKKSQEEEEPLVGNVNQHSESFLEGNRPLGTQSNYDSPYTVMAQDNSNITENRIPNNQFEKEDTDSRLKGEKGDPLEAVLTDVVFGRPDISAIIAQKTEEYLKNPLSKKVGVFYCGPLELGNIIQKVCKQYSRHNLQINYHQEKF